MLGHSLPDGEPAPPLARTNLPSCQAREVLPHPLCGCAKLGCFGPWLQIGQYPCAEKQPCPTRPLRSCDAYSAIDTTLQCFSATVRCVVPVSGFALNHHGSACFSLNRRAPLVAYSSSTAARRREAPSSPESPTFRIAVLEHQLESLGDRMKPSVPGSVFGMSKPSRFMRLNSITPHLAGPR